MHKYLSPCVEGFNVKRGTIEATRRVGSLRSEGRSYTRHSFEDAPTSRSKHPSASSAFLFPAHYSLSWKISLNRLDIFKPIRPEPVRSQRGDSGPARGSHPPTQLSRTPGFHPSWPGNPSCFHSFIILFCYNYCIHNGLHLGDPRASAKMGRCLDCRIFHDLLMAQCRRHSFTTMR